MALSRAALKTFFETNDFPTQEEFAMLIDSVANIIDDAPSAKVPVPVAFNSVGAPGQFATDGLYLYIYTGNGTVHSWPRVAIGEW